MKINKWLWRLWNNRFIEGINSVNRGARWATVYVVAKSKTDFFLLFSHQVVSDSASWTAAHQASLSLTISQSLPRFTSIELVMPPNYLIIVTLASFCLQYFPASGSFSVSRLFESHGQSVWASASSSILPMNIQSCFPVELTGLISL